MSTTATPQTVPAIKSPKQQFLDAFERETATTLKVLKAYPQEQSELRPHERLKPARELGALLNMEMGVIEAVVRGTYKFPPSRLPAPKTWQEVVDTFEQIRTSALDALRTATDESLVTGTAAFPTAPKTVGEWPKMDFFWFLLSDQIHHRGQLSIYLRIAGGKLPSIYGPTADEPWF